MFATRFTIHSPKRAPTLNKGSKQMTIRLGVVMDDINTINVKKDTTLAMLWAFGGAIFAAAIGLKLIYDGW